MVYQQRTINMSDDLYLGEDEENWFEFICDQLDQLEFESRFVDVTINEAIELVTGG